MSVSISSDSPSLTLRSAAPEDASVLLALICGLAEYERCSHQVTGTAKTLGRDLKGDRPPVEAILAEQGGQARGFALFFSTYSTFATRSGLYLEDLFVLPDWRGRGIGKALFKAVAERALVRGCGRLEWSVSDWNEPAIGFYRHMGAQAIAGGHRYRIAEDKLRGLVD